MREADIEQAHKGRKLDITLIPNPHFIPYQYLIKKFDFKNKSVNLLNLATNLFEPKPYAEMLYTLGVTNGYDPVVLNYLSNLSPEMPQGLTGNAKAQLCVIVEKIEDKANLELGIPRFGDVQTVNPKKRFEPGMFKNIIDTAFAQIGFTPSASRAPTYPCD